MDRTLDTYAAELHDEFERSGVAFASSDARLQAQYYRALGILSTCILPSPLGTPMLIEGGVYRGCWLESTATMGAETLSRFCPGLARTTFELLARSRRADGLIPYKILPSDPARPGSGGVAIWSGVSPGPDGHSPRTFGVEPRGA
jgi:hypothetical protein